MPIVRTVGGFLRHEIPKVKGSRFFASLDRVASAEDALAFVERHREEFRDATHNCFAWRLDTTDHGFRYSDDGEPNGTGGRPILQEIVGRRLEQIVVVVTRYFGGTKLGTGGLLRAYAASAAAALDLAPILEAPVTETLTVRFAYDLTGTIQGVLSAFELSPVRSDFGAETELDLLVPLETTADLRAALIEATAGRVHLRPSKGGAPTQ